MGYWDYQGTTFFFPQDPDPQTGSFPKGTCWFFSANKWIPDPSAYHCGASWPAQWTLLLTAPQHIPPCPAARAASQAAPQAQTSGYYSRTTTLFWLDGVIENDPTVGGRLTCKEYWFWDKLRWSGPIKLGRGGPIVFDPRPARDMLAGAWAGVPECPGYTATKAAQAVNNALGRTTQPAVESIESKYSSTKPPRPRKERIRANERSANCAVCGGRTKVLFLTSYCPDCE